MGEAGLSMARQQLAEDEAVAATIYETQLHANMGGQLFVRSVEVPESLGGPFDGALVTSHRVDVARPQERLVVEQEHSEQAVGIRHDKDGLAVSLHGELDLVLGHAPSGCRRVALDAGTPSFFRLSFREAVEAFLARDIVTPDEFAAMSAEMRARSFSATRLASQHLIDRAHELLRRFIEEGGTVDGFIRGMQDGSITLGIEPGTPWYLETVARTNVQTAYGQGRLQQLESPAVVSARPFVEYRTAGDGRVRPSHAALRGVVFDRSSDPGWRRFAPPLGFNCRCAVVTRRESQVDQSRIRTSAELAAEGLGPDKGWSGPGGYSGRSLTTRRNAPRSQQANGHRRTWN